MMRPTAPGSAYGCRVTGGDEPEPVQSIRVGDHETRTCRRLRADSVCRMEVLIERGEASVEEVLGVLRQSGLAERRPIDDRPRLNAALDATDLLVTARAAGRLVGFARSVTDFSWACYLADLAVVHSFQGQGLGVRLVEATRSALHPECLLTLLAAPAAVGFYDGLGLARHPAAFFVRGHDRGL